VRLSFIISNGFQQEYIKNIADLKSVLALLAPKDALQLLNSLPLDKIVKDKTTQLTLIFEQLPEDERSNYIVKNGYVASIKSTNQLAIILPLIPSQEIIPFLTTHSLLGLIPSLEDLINLLKAITGKFNIVACSELIKAFKSLIHNRDELNSLIEATGLINRYSIAELDILFYNLVYYEPTRATLKGFLAILEDLPTIERQNFIKLHTLQLTSITQIEDILQLLRHIPDSQIYDFILEYRFLAKLQNIEDLVAVLDFLPTENERLDLCKQVTHLKFDVETLAIFLGEHIFSGETIWQLPQSKVIVNDYTTFSAFKSLIRQYLAANNWQLPDCTQAIQKADAKDLSLIIQDLLQVPYGIGHYQDVIQNRLASLKLDWQSFVATLPRSAQQLITALCLQHRYFEVDISNSIEPEAQEALDFEVSISSMIESESQEESLDKLLELYSSPEVLAAYPGLVHYYIAELYLTHEVPINAGSEDLMLKKAIEFFIQADISGYTLLSSERLVELATQLSKEKLTKAHVYLAQNYLSQIERFLSYDWQKLQVYCSGLKQALSYYKATPKAIVVEDLELLQDKLKCLEDIAGLLKVIEQEELSIKFLEKQNEKMLLTFQKLRLELAKLELECKQHELKIATTFIPIIQVQELELVNLILRKQIAHKDALNKINLKINANHLRLNKHLHRQNNYQYKLKSCLQQFNKLYRDYFSYQDEFLTKEKERLTEQKERLTEERKLLQEALCLENANQTSEVIHDNPASTTIQTIPHASLSSSRASLFAAVDSSASSNSTHEPVHSEDDAQDLGVTSIGRAILIINYLSY